MKAVKIVMVLVVVFGVMNWMRHGSTVPFMSTLPLVSGPGKPPLYTVAGLAMLAIAAWGISRMNRPAEDDDADGGDEVIDEPDYGEDEREEDDEDADT